MAGLDVRKTLSLASVGALLGALLMAPPGAAAPDRTTVRPAGPTGGQIALFGGDVDEADVVMGSDGTAYVAWTANDSTLRSCTLPPGATACAGGVRSVSTLGLPAGMELTTTGSGAHAVFVAEIPGAGNGPYTTHLVTATISPDGTLSPATVGIQTVQGASLLSTTLAPDGRVWAVVQPGAGKTGVVVHPGLASPFEVATPYWAADAQIAFGAQTVMAITEYGSITKPIAAAAFDGTTFAPFADVPGTWNVGGFGLATAGGRIRLVTSVGNASYESGVATWNGSAFGRLVRSGTRRCTPTGHDAVTDASGRVADVSYTACGTSIDNYGTGTGPAGRVAWGATSSSPGVAAQIATTSRGTGWVVWGNFGTGGALENLVAAPVLLPAATAKASKKNRAGRVTTLRLSGCLPPVDVAVPLKVKRGKGWRLVSKALTLGGKKVRGRKVRGARLAPGSRKVLLARATFKKGGATRTVRVRSTIRGCPA